jgi:iron complex outermembrane recepter protein
MYCAESNRECDFMPSTSLTRQSLVILLTGASALGALPAKAQVAQNEAAALEEIIVTAQRREERLIDVPIAISAVTAQDLEQRGARRLQDLQFSIPGLNIVETSPGSERLQIRGISQQAGLPTVATYIDEMNMNPNAVTGGVDIRSVDLERIEVLKGPQPTLYGEGSMGGTIRYITANPDLEQLVARGTAEIGAVKNGNTAYRGEAAVSVPIAPGTFAVRVAGAYEYTGGYIDTPRGDDQNGTRYTTGRIKALFQASETFSISAMYMHHEWDQKDASYGFKNGTYNYLNSFAQPAKGQYDVINLVGTLDLGFAEFTSSTGYLKSKGRIDVYFPFGFPLGGGVILPLDSSTRSAGEFKRWTQEFRLTSSGEGPFKWLVGATYTDDKSKSGFSFLPVTAPIVLAPGQTSEAWAIYGEGTYTFGIASLTLGARYYSDDRSNAARTDSNKFNTFNPRVNLSVKTGDSGLVYLNAAKGFRSGGFNTPGLFAPGEETYDPEKLWTYEGGFKQQFLDRKLSIEGSIYYHDYDGIQSILLPTDNSPRIGRTINSGVARGWGQELSIVARPDSTLTATFTVGHNDLSYRSASLAVRPGDRLDNVPTWTTSAALDYRKPISETVTIFANASIAHTSGFTSTLRLFGDQTFNGVFVPGLGIVQRDGTRFPTIVRALARNTVNARFGAEFGSITAFVYGQNLTNDFNSVYAGGVIQESQGARPRPRTLGAGVSFNF